MPGRGPTPDSIAAVARAIDSCAGDRVRTVHQDGESRFRLDLRGRGARRDLVVDLDHRAPRVGLDPPQPAPAHPTPLAFSLRRLLRDALLEGAESVPGERALVVRFRLRGQARSLWIELFGGQANLYVLDEMDHVALTPRGAVARRRGASRGTAFVPSPPRPRESAEPVEPPAVPAAVPTGDAPSTARAEPRPAPGRARLLRFLRRRARRVQGSLRALEAMAARAGEAEGHRRRGELLRAAFDRCEPGQHSVRVPDYTQDPLQWIEIPLDPDVPLGEQVAASFRAERKSRRAVAEAAERLPAARALCAAVDAALCAVENATDVAGIERALAHLPAVVRREAAVGTQSAPRRAGPVRARPWRTFRSLDGLAIRVGRDARGNDRLTLHAARPWDLFLHVRGAPGSHVIVTLDRGKSVPRETLLDAAELACAFSERHRAPQGEVDYTPRRYVRKPRGAPAGQVVLERSKTLTVRRDEARRERLQTTRPPPEPTDPQDGGTAA